ncbi:Aste57867_9858 [Aphanomyces stellatus]|uniref:Aste57867_9858 protein n=1 Tax=Aphanomyces stellatus TaxID=120398 RepID=A0A485KP72_9STRA|nr:hypothetical protein As57867_009819 [Aphanomyces stellatus]VFT86737.1 Aste57867_9858 [Aphanomyces stellatus]
MMEMWQAFHQSVNHVMRASHDSFPRMTAYVHEALNCLEAKMERVTHGYDAIKHKCAVAEENEVLYDDMFRARGHLNDMNALLMDFDLLWKSLYSTIPAVMKDSLHPGKAIAGDVILPRMFDGILNTHALADVMRQDVRAMIPGDIIPPAPLMVSFELHNACAYPITIESCCVTFNVLDRCFESVVAIHDTLDEALDTAHPSILRLDVNLVNLVDSSCTSARHKFPSVDVPTAAWSVRKGLRRVFLHPTTSSITILDATHLI